MYNVYNCRTIKRASASGLKSSEYKIGDCSVLVIEPDLVNQFILKKYFDKRKIDLDFTSDLNDGLKMVQVKSYDLIFLDIPYLVKEVISLIVKLRKLDAYMTIPIIGMTVMLRPEVTKRAKEVGVCEVVLRPFNLTSILGHYLGI